jgi:hypothetical protein
MRCFKSDGWCNFKMEKQVLLVFIKRMEYTIQEEVSSDVFQKIVVI